MSENLSEHARQLYEAILDEGFISPAHTWEQSTILTYFMITSGSSSDWLKELETRNLIRRIESAHFSEPEKFYAVPPLGFVAKYQPEPLTFFNLPARMTVYRARNAEPGPKVETVAQEPASTADPALGDDPVDWAKWGAIFTAASIVVGIVLWKFS